MHIIRGDGGLEEGGVDGGRNARPHSRPLSRLRERWTRRPSPLGRAAQPDRRENRESATTTVRLGGSALAADKGGEVVRTRAPEDPHPCPSRLRARETR